MSKEQRKIFDFEAINQLYNDNAFTIEKGKIRFDNDMDDYFKLDKSVKIDFDYKDIEGNITDIKTNKSSIFLDMLIDEKIDKKLFNKISFNNLNYNAENILFHETFDLNKKIYIYF